MTLSEHVWNDKDLSLQKPSIGLDFAALRQQWYHLCFTEKCSKETKSNIKTNKHFYHLKYFTKGLCPLPNQNTLITVCLLMPDLRKFAIKTKGNFYFFQTFLKV